MQHALKKKLETTLGLSVSASSSTSGGVVGPIGGAAWSAKMSAALSTNMQGDTTSGSSLERHVKSGSTHARHACPLRAKICPYTFAQHTAAAKGSLVHPTGPLRQRTSRHAARRSTRHSTPYQTQITSYRQNLSERLSMSTRASRPALRSSSSLVLTLPCRPFLGASTSSRLQ